ncbi:UNVERIFIED_CONTAM: Chloride channel protein CLC-c [Sesamum radiatum]|uniref:Chloride channel protein CLC-c n=1 Tax=Sesamum radiatum TaxID=300843 RepID=A0AAW2RWH7_SESRA
MKGLPYMEAHAKPYMRNLTAGDVCSGPLFTFSGVQKVGDIVHALRMTRHNGFPVIDEPPFSEAPELCGLVLRSHLLVLLKGKKFTKNRVLSGSELLRFFHAFDFAKPGSGKGLKVEDLDLSVEEMEMYVDLHPITNTSPYMVVETMSLAKAAVLFRELGLRHLCVVPKTPGHDLCRSIYWDSIQSSSTTRDQPNQTSWEPNHLGLTMIVYKRLLMPEDEATLVFSSGC